MLAYQLKPILELLPEALPLVKKASVDQDLPTDSIDSCIASELAITYSAFVSKKSLDPDAMTKVAQAVTLYDLEKTIHPLKQTLIKRAHDRVIASADDAKDTYLAKQAGFSGDSVLDKAKKAEEMYKEAQALGESPSDAVKRYAGHLPMSKKAAIDSLSARFHLSKEAGFAKLACAIGNLPETGVRPETIQDICRTVTDMDYKLGLAAQGFDFYRDALILEKEAAAEMTVSLAGQRIPYSSLEKVGKDRIGQYLGKDVANEMDAGPQNTKAVFETLPLDMQHLLVGMVKNV